MIKNLLFSINLTKTAFASIQLAAPVCLMKKIFFLSVICVLFSIPQIYAQSERAKVYYDEGKVFYTADKYKEAIESFKMALNSDPDYSNALFYMGCSYSYDGQYENAINTFALLEKANPNYWAQYHFEWAKAYFNMDKLSEAKVQFQSYIEKDDKTPKNMDNLHRAKFKLDYCTQSPIIRAMPKTMGDAVNLGPKVNSKWADYMPQSDPKGKIIYFTSDRTAGFDQSDKDAKEGDEDLYSMEKTESGWSDPTPLPAPINSDKNDGAAAFTGDGQTMVYAACGRVEGIGNCDLYIVSLEGSKWSKPANLGNVVNSKDWDSQPTISSDGSQIIFSSNRDGGYGGTDLYEIRKNKFGDWGVPVNLGATINTPYAETCPFLSADGKTLYFGSKGHPGFGGTDMFKTVHENNKWSDPVNLGAPLNSEKDDQYFTIGGSGEVAYFASERAGGFGNRDLYSIAIPEAMRPQPIVVISGIVTNAKDGNPLGTWVLIEDINTGELIATNKSNSQTGKYQVVLPSGRNYSVSSNKEGFFFNSQKFEVPKDVKYQEITKNIELKPIEKGARVVLNNIFFETGKAALTKESKVELEKAFQLMKTNPTMVIEVGGHTDNVGTPEGNAKLSNDRAKSVRDYLIGAGIAEAKIQSKGYGATVPVATNETAEGKQANRRTEFVILEY